MKRREFLKRTAALAVIGPRVAGCADVGTSSGAADATVVDVDAGADGATTAPKRVPTYQYDGPQGPDTLFSHGVASGDPMHDRVVLWTRVTLNDVAVAPTSVHVFWEVAADAAFTNRVCAGQVSTGPEVDWTVHVDALGLQPKTTYFYRFLLLGQASVVGRARTAPLHESSTLRFGVCSCARYSAGLYVGYRGLAQDASLDAVLHLGDYIYESDGGGGFRPNDPPHETVTLADYRRRYARQRTDKDLQLLHATHPMIAVWDDHESANNSYRDGTSQGGHDEATQGAWADRKAAAVQAWHEWMPVRAVADRRIWRHLRYGALCDLVMLDTRLWGRSKQTTGSNKTALEDPKRTLLGMDQEQWLADRITQSKARWLVLGQQVMCSPLMLGGVVLNTDQWDGYQASRQRLLDAIDARGRGDVVVLTGDIHSCWANELVADPQGYEPGSGKAWGVEFVTPGITSNFPAQIPKGIVEGGVKSNPHIRWFDIGSRGYFVLELDAASARADWYLYKDINNDATQPKWAAAWRALHGETILQKVTERPG